MIACIFHEGSGLGNQLHRYVAVRCIALDKGYEFGVINPESFKGKDFMTLDMGVEVKGLLHEFNESRVINSDNKDVRGYDLEINGIKDFTLVDGEFQDEEYFKHRLGEVREWLKTELLEMDKNICVINFRGGEYVGIPDLFLPQEYWNRAQMGMMLENASTKFEVHTDDVETARKFFQWHCTRDIGLNWRSIRYAKRLILSNSSFAILPALLNENAEKVIAPRFWANHNKGGYWQLPQNEYKRFTYI